MRLRSQSASSNGWCSALYCAGCRPNGETPRQFKPSVPLLLVRIQERSGSRGDVRLAEISGGTSRNRGAASPLGAAARPSIAQIRHAGADGDLDQGPDANKLRVHLVSALLTELLHHERSPIHVREIGVGGRHGHIVGVGASAPLIHSEADFCLLDSYHLPATASPPVSWAAATISKPRSWSSAYTFCQPGRSRRQPHQEAQVTTNTFRPRKSERWTTRPLRSGTAKSGAIRSE